MSEKKFKEKNYAQFVKPNLTTSRTQNIIKKKLKLKGIISRISTHNIQDSKFISEHIKHNYEQQCDYDNIKLYAINLVKQLAIDHCKGYKFYDRMYYGDNDYIIKTKYMYDYIYEKEKRKMNPIELYSGKFEEYGARMVKPTEIINMISNKKIFDHTEDKNFENELKDIFNKTVRLNKLKSSILSDISLFDKLEIDNPDFYDEISKIEQIEKSLSSALKSFEKSQTSCLDFSK